MYNQTLLMMPGPVPMAESVRGAMLNQAINHRSKQLWTANGAGQIDLAYALLQAQRRLMNILATLQVVAIIALALLC